MEPIVAAVTGRVFKANEKRIMNLLGLGAKAAYEALTFNCASYVQHSFDRCSKVSTLLDRDEAILVADIYVKTYLEHKSNKIDDEDFLGLIQPGAALVVQGAGGCGKSMLMKHLFLNTFETSSMFIPLFIELRGLNELATKDLLTFIYYTVTGPSGATMSIEQTKNGIKDHLFMLYLDGFDEIDNDQIANVQRQIIKIKKDYPEAIIIVSSRPDDRFSSPIEFRNFHVQPMAKKEVLTLIDKLNYDAGLRKKFHDRVKKDLYDQNQSFLSNPLLVTIMMITYHQFAEIPQQIHLFYEFAFEALFFRHDASKEAAYSRKKKTKLVINDFRSLLSSFSIFSYIAEKFSLSASEVLDTIGEAKKIETMHVDSQDFFDDMVKAVCIIQPEGTQFVFTHRSFQEYFSAVFLTRGKTAQVADMLDWVLKNRANDKVIPMAFAMAQALIEREWILPNLRRLHDKEFSSSLEFILHNGGVPVVFGGSRHRSIGIEHRGAKAGFVFMLPRLYFDVFRQGETFFKEEDRLKDDSLLTDFAADERLKISDENLFSKVSSGIWMEHICKRSLELLKILEERHTSIEGTIKMIIKPLKAPTIKKNERRVSNSCRPQVNRPMTSLTTQAKPAPALPSQMIDATIRMGLGRPSPLWIAPP